MSKETSLSEGARTCAEVKNKILLDDCATSPDDE